MKRIIVIVLASVTLVSCFHRRSAEPFYPEMAFDQLRDSVGLVHGLRPKWWNRFVTGDTVIWKPKYEGRCPRLAKKVTCMEGDSCLLWETDVIESGLTTIDSCSERHLSQLWVKYVFRYDERSPQDTLGHNFYYVHNGIPRKISKEEGKALLRIWHKPIYVSTYEKHL